MDIPDIPKAIRYDVLLIILGVGLIILPFYLKLLQLNPINSSYILITGLLLLSFGAGYIKNDYDLEMELKELKYAKLKYELIGFFRKEELISDKDKKDLIKSLKKIIGRK